MHKFNLVNKTNTNEEPRDKLDIRKYDFVEAGIRKEMPLSATDSKPDSLHFQILRLVYKNSLVEGIFWEGETIDTIAKAVFDCLKHKSIKIEVLKGFVHVLCNETSAQNGRVSKSMHPHYIFYSTDNFDDSFIEINNNPKYLSPDLVISDISINTPSCFIQPHGLINIGNTCFMNSGLQSLLAVSSFINRLVCCEIGDISCAFTDLLLSNKQPKTFWNVFTKKVHRFGDYMQHDVQEFVGSLLDCIDTEHRSRIKLMTNPEERKTIVESCFEGQMCSRIVCSECNHIYTVLEPFITLSLPIPHPDKFHPDIFYAGSVCKKLKIPKTTKVKDVKYFLNHETSLIEDPESFLGQEITPIPKNRHNDYERDKKFMIVSVNSNKRKILYDDDCIGNYSKIFCYEYDPTESYSWVVLKRKGLIIDNFHSHFLLRHGDDINEAVDKWTKNASGDIMSRFDVSSCEEGDSSFQNDEFGKQKNDLSNESSISTGNDLKRHRTPEDESVKNKQSQLFYVSGDKSATICDLNPDISFFKSIRSEQIMFLKNSVNYSPSTNVTLLDCIHNFVAEEILTDTNRPYCGNCKNKTEHTKELKLSKLPECLILHLKRFSYAGNTKKIMTKVVIDEYLKLGNKEYKLVSIANHNTKSAQSGHCTAYVNRADKWWLCNDSTVTKVNRFIEDNAYLIFYESINKPL